MNRSNFELVMPPILPERFNSISMAQSHGVIVVGRDLSEASDMPIVVISPLQSEDE